MTQKGPEGTAGQAAPVAEKKRKRSGTENRKDKRVRTLRLSDEQDAELVKNAHAMRVSVGGFIRLRCCTEQDITPRQIIPLELHELVRLRGQLARLGNNLNQIVRRENFGEFVFAEDYRDALAGVREGLGQCHGLLREAQRKMRA